MLGRVHTWIGGQVVQALVAVVPRHFVLHVVVLSLLELVRLVLGAGALLDFGDHVSVLQVLRRVALRVRCQLRRLKVRLKVDMAPAGMTIRLRLVDFLNGRNVLRQHACGGRREILAVLARVEVGLPCTGRWMRQSDLRLQWQLPVVLRVTSRVPPLKEGLVAVKWATRGLL